LNKSEHSLVHFYENKKLSKIEKILKQIKIYNSKVDNKKFSKNNLNKIIDNKSRIKKKERMRNNDKNTESSMNSTRGGFESNYKIEDAYSNKASKDYKEEEYSNKEFNIDEYKIITQLGQGTFSKIYLVQDKSKNLYSMKKIILSDELDVKSALNEYQISSKLKHENIVKLLGLYTSKLDITTYVIYILMEVGKTDWEKEIRSNIDKKIYYKEIDLISIIKQLIGAFSFLQKKNIVHRDIKPQNVLIFKGNKYKLADFGESKEISNINYSLLNGSLRGTELYMSPLLLNGLRNGQIDVKHNLYKSDVYSFGLCLLYAATSCYKILYDIRKYVNMKELAIFIENNLKNRYCKKVVDLIISMLEIYEEKRPDFIELERIIDKLFP
jgi:serine/threonine protein kinase